MHSLRYELISIMNEKRYAISSEGKPTVEMTQSELRKVLSNVYSDDSIDLMLLGAEVKPGNYTHINFQTFKPATFTITRI